jgi:S-adenosylmethionine:tRNA ribosyltransferase-isomerase
MIAATRPVQRPVDARLAIVDERGIVRHRPRRFFLSALRRGDLVVANDAATIPASLAGTHDASDAPIELRLAARGSLDPCDVKRFTAIVFGAGDYRMRTEDRPNPPALAPGDRLTLGPLKATVEALAGHPRLVKVLFDGTPDEIWAGIARHGTPVQYAHMKTPLRLWDVWTPIAGAPVAFEPPSAGFVLDWRALAAMRGAGISFATLTHAAGLSSTGDAALDQRLPLDEPYRISRATADAIARTRASGGRIVAIGTTVVRALEHAASRDGRVQAGEGIANQRLGPGAMLRVVDAILSGTHEPGTSHYELLRAFADAETLQRLDEALDERGYRTHEFGDSIFLPRLTRARPLETRGRSSRTRQPRCCRIRPWNSARSAEPWSSA